MRPLILSFALALSAAGLCAQQAPPATAADIMVRVAANQDASEVERMHYVYVQHARVLSRKGKTVMCEETTDTRLTPTAKGTSQKLIKLEGRLRHKGTYIGYTQLPNKKKTTPNASREDHDDLHVSVDDGDDDMDRDLVEDMRNNLTNDKSKDGIGAGLFPFTTKSQADYQFTLLGSEPRNGHECFHIAFRPMDKDDYG